MEEKISMKDDIVFKAFFTKNKNHLKSFLSAILGEEIKIEEVMHDVRLEQLAKEMKYGILDLQVKLTDGKIIDVEMQLKNNHNIEKRTTFYAGKKIVEQLGPKENFNNLKDVIIITILDYTLTKLPEYITKTVRVAENYKEYELNNNVKYIYIELEKFRKTNPNMKDKIDQWLAFIDMERRDLLEMAKKENEEIKEAIEDYEELTGDEKVKRLAELRLLSKLEENSALATARDEGTKKGMEKGLQEGMEKGLQEGMEKGLQEGMEKGLQEGMEKGLKEGIQKGEEETREKMVKKLIEKNINIKDIIEITGLSEEKIENIKKKIINIKK